MHNSFFKSIITALIATLPLLSIEAQERIVIESSNLKCNDTVLVYTPRDKFTPSDPAIDGKMPALFLLHGWSGKYSDWSRRADIQHYADKYGFTIITPDGFYNSWYLNNMDSSKMQWRKFFDEELYPLIMERYNLTPEKSFISGLSMGGHGAINIFLDDTTRFMAAGSMSGVLNLHHTRLKETQINEVLGEYSFDNTLFDKSSAINRLENIKGGKKMLVISCGAQDPLANSSVEFSEKCDSLGIANTLIMSPGVHSWDY
jgi:S-formylglutathione hydrolase FrmB